MERQRPRPYYGFSCLQNGEQFQAIVDHAVEKTGRRLMLGTHMSSKSIRGIAVKRPKRTLTVDEAREVYCQSFSGTLRDVLFPVIHFNSDNQGLIDAEMLLVDRLVHQPSGGRELSTAGRQIFKGFQLNNALPEPGHLRWFQDNHLWNGKSRFEIILQLGGYALERAENDPVRLAEIVSAYDGAIDYVLLDASGGRGLAVDPEWARPFLRQIRRACPWVGLGFAGGLGPDTLNLVEPLAEEFPDLSIDAESKLRDSEDNFVVEKALLYLDRAIKIFEKR